MVIVQKKNMPQAAKYKQRCDPSCGHGHTLRINNLPECVVLCNPCVMYLELGLCCLDVLSNQFSTSSTAWGFFFCSILLMLLFISNTAHCSGIPCKHVIATRNTKNKNKMNFSKKSFCQSSNFPKNM